MIDWPRQGDAFEVLMRFSSFIIKNLFRRKVRSLLTATGIAVAIGAMVALLGITDSFTKSTVDSFAKHGIDLLITAGNVDQLSSNLDIKLRDQIARIPGVQKIGTGLLALLDCQRGTGKAVFPQMVQGWEPGSFLFDSLKLEKGRLLQPGDWKKAILGPTVAANTKLGIGDILKIRDEPFEVVGIAEGVSVFENGFVTIPLQEMQRLSDMEGRVTGFSVVLDKTGPHAPKVEVVRQEIEDLKGPDGKLLRLSALSTQEYASTMVHIQIARAMAWMTSIVAVLIGAIGMLNTMIMSVLERVREIGILRAVGWRKSRVVQMILGEAVLLSLTGALLGIVGAAMVMQALMRLPAVNGFLTGQIAPWVMGQGILIALVVGLLGGVYPAYRASRLLPTEAVRHE
jgi:putative ABC transport system permease protein